MKFHSGLDGLNEEKSCFMTQPERTGILTKSKKIHGK